jgi:hypothetical protein
MLAPVSGRLKEPAHLSPEDGSTGPANFVTGVKRQAEWVTAGALRPIHGHLDDVNAHVDQRKPKHHGQ